MKNQIPWEKIRRKCPKAFEVLCKNERTISISSIWMPIGIGRVDTHLITKMPHWAMRFLYDFFDAQEIFVDTPPLVGRSALINGKTVPPCFMFTIQVTDPNDNGFASKERFNDRPNAETAAFTKAFELLEEKLNKT